MPELPEIECLTRSLQAAHTGDELIAVDFYRPDIRRPIPQEKIIKTIVGQPFRKFLRRSKYILGQTDAGTLVFHLGMSGKLLVQNVQKPTRKHTHAVFSLQNHKLNHTKFLHFVDPRRFGLIDIICSDNLNSVEYLASLGVEPLDIPVEKLAEIIRTAALKSTRPIKNILMDGQIVVGVGNIYANEALFCAGIHPMDVGKKIAPQKFPLLASSVRKILLDAIEAGGTTFRDYRHADGTRGAFVRRLNVYARSQKKCHKCDKIVEEIRISGRSSFLCPGCQRLSS